MKKYIFDSTRLLFFPTILRDLYRDYPEQGVFIDEETFSKFRLIPDGKILSADADGYPCFIDSSTIK